MACAIIGLLFARSDRPHDSIPTDSAHQGSTIAVAFAMARPDSLCFPSGARLGSSCRTGRFGIVAYGSATNGSTSLAVSARVSSPRQNVRFADRSNDIDSNDCTFSILAHGKGQLPVT